MTMNRRMFSTKEKTHKAKHAKRVATTTLSKASKPISVRASVPQVGRNYFTTHIAGANQTQRETLRYTNSGYWTVTAGSYGEEIVAYMNSPYLPIVGYTSAAAYNKWIAIYSKAYALNSRITVQAQVINETGAEGVLWGITITTNSNTLTNSQNAMNTGLNTYVLNGFNPDVKTLSLSLDCKKFFGVDDILDGPQFYCTNAASPSQVICAHVWTNSYSLVTQYINFVVTIDYDVLFTDPYPVT